MKDFEKYLQKVNVNGLRVIEIIGTNFEQWN